MTNITYSQIKKWIERAKLSALEKGLIKDTTAFRDEVRKIVYIRRHNYLQIAEWEDRQKRQGYRI